MKISNEKRRAIKKIYDRVFSQIRQKNYYFKKPILKIITIDSSTHGSYCWGGFSYSKFETVIKVNGLRSLSEIEATIKHEFAHMINHITYGYAQRKPSHTKKFWEICKDDMKLRKKDYYITTKEMKKVWKR